jgi:hypothetical protein
MLHDVCVPPYLSGVLERVRGVSLLGALGDKDPYALASLSQHLNKTRLKH